MPQPLELYRKKAGFTSDVQLARALLERYDNLNWGMTFRSLGTTLGLINKGKTGWWQNHPESAKALAELLDVTPEELGIHPQETRDLHRFPEFPELPPLNLDRESPCDLGRPVSVSEDRSCEEANLWLGQGEQTTIVRQPASGVHWLHFPTGRGVDLFWAQLLRRSKYETRRAHTIQDAREYLQRPRHLILRIDADGGDADLHTLATMHKDMALLIVAPHAAPIRSNPGTIHTLYLWERYDNQLGNRREIDLRSAPFEQIRTFEWQLHSDWIKRLLSWIEKRLDTHQSDTHFTTEEMLRWLQEFPYLQRHIYGPGDILHLSRLLHHLPTSKWPKAKIRDAGHRLLKHILPTPESAQRDYREVTLAAWSSETAEWGASLPLESWERLATVQSDSAQEKLNALIEADDRATRVKLISQFKRLPSHPNTTRLAELHLLAPEPGEEHSLRPRFMPWLLARDHVIHCMTHHDLESWALHCFDSKRRLVVDAALDALPLDQLIPIAEKLPASLNGNAAGIAAAEALFYTIGSRMQSNAQIPPALLSLAPRVLNQLDADDTFAFPRPWSKDIQDDSAKRQWIATCWAWSLSTRPESLPSCFQSSWLFPGWSNDLDEANHWEWVESLIVDKRRHKKSEGLPLILQRARDLTERLEKPPELPPAILLPFLIIEAAKGRWPLEPGWWIHVFDKDWAEDILIEQLGGVPPQRLPGLLSSLIDHVAGATRENKYAYLSFLSSRLRIAIMKRLPSGALSTAFSKEQIQLLLSTPESLPPALRSEALEFLLTSHGNKGKCVEKLISLSTEVETPTLLRWLETEQWRDAAQQIWRLAPHQAKAILSNASNEAPKTVRALLLTCPDLTYCLPLISTNSHLFGQQELKVWVRAFLPEAGQHSRGLMKLLTPT